MPAGLATQKPTQVGVDLAPAPGDGSAEAVRFFLERRPEVKGNRHAIRKKGRGANAKRFVGRPDSVKRAEQQLALLASPHAPRHVWTKDLWAVRFDVVFVFEPAKSWDAWKKLEALEGRYYPTEERLGDRDNLHKLIADVLQLGFYESDSQIVDGIVAKRYGPRAGYWIQLTPLPQAQERQSYSYPGVEDVVRSRSELAVAKTLPEVAA